MLGDSAVSGLEFGSAVGGHQDGGHHSQGAESGGDHVAHDIAVVVLAGPDVAAFAADDAGNGVVNEGVEVGNDLHQLHGHHLRLVWRPEKAR